jgi:hypothetical protein
MSEADLRPTGREWQPALAVTAALLALVSASLVLQLARDRIYGELQPAGDVLYVRSGATLEKIALSYRAILADVYWIRAIQHYGGTKLSAKPEKRYDLLYPLLDITTTLDPFFNIAYRFGAIFLAESYPGGAGRPDLAVALLEKGFRARPEKWEYLQDIGFVYYWWLHDYGKAASWFEKASAVKGAPWWLKSLAAVTLTQGGDRRSSRLLWQQLRETADNDWLRANADWRLTQLDALDQIDELRFAVRQYAQRLGRLPQSWLDLERAGLVRGRPADPTGSPYELDSTTGHVTVARTSRLFPLPTDPQGGR